jgi:hypothetical protein
VLDAEVVAWDVQKKCLLPFQVLKRERLFFFLMRCTVFLGFAILLGSTGFIPLPCSFNPIEPKTMPLGVFLTSHSIEALLFTCAV